MLGSINIALKNNFVLLRFVTLCDEQLFAWAQLHKKQDDLTIHPNILQIKGFNTKVACFLVTRGEINQGSVATN
jgi:hypothetical protein